MQFDHILRLLAAADEAARRARSEVDTAYSALRATVEAEEGEQAALRAELQHQQQQHQQQQQQQAQELEQQREQHQQQQLSQQQQHEQQMAAAVAAATAAATAAEKSRLQARVGPVLLDMQQRERLYMRRLAEAEQLVAVQAEELDATRSFVFEVLDEQADALHRLGM